MGKEVAPLPAYRVICNILSDYEDEKKITNSYPITSEVKKEYEILLLPREAHIFFESESVLCCRNTPTLFTNYPIDCEVFNRDEYFPLQSTLNANERWSTCIEIRKAGAYQFYIEYANGAKTRKMYFVVEPKLQWKDINDKLFLPLDGVNCLTVVTKCLGNIKRWKKILLNIKKLNYNIIHFTPPQKLGWSNSAYSLYHHLQLTDQLLPSPDESNYDEVLKHSDSDIEEFKTERLQTIVKDMLKNFGVFSMCDVVWNHTSSNSPWLLEHPEAGYTLQTSPYLRPAYCLDLSLNRFSRVLESQKILIKKVEDVDGLLKIYEEEEFNHLNLLEFFTVNVNDTVNDYLDYLNNNKSYAQEEMEESAHTHHPFQTVFTSHCVYSNHKRHGSKVYKRCIVDIFASEKEHLSTEEICTSIRRAVDHYNTQCKLALDSDKKSIFSSLRKTIIYHKLEANDQPDKPISPTNPLVFPYFVTLVQGDYTNITHTDHDIDDDTADDDNESEVLDDDVNELMEEKVGDKRYLFDPQFWEHKRKRRNWKEIDGEDDIALAHSGWVWGMKASEDFASSKSKVYFTRELIVWADSVKLRYGKSADENPFLWDLMKKYTMKMASIFHGFRIDNCHSTPIHVAQYMIDAARSIQPELYITAELFTDDASMDILYCESLGIASLIREAMQAHSPFDFSEKIHGYSNGLKNAVGSFDSDFESVHHTHPTPYSIHPRHIHANIKRINSLSSSSPSIEPHQHHDNHQHISSDNNNNNVVKSEQVGDVEKYNEISLRGSPMRSLFYDCTHDNKTPYEKRSIYDHLSNSSLVTFSNCATGSVFGYDQLVPHRIDVVDEKRLYKSNFINNLNIQSIHDFKDLHEIFIDPDTSTMEHFKSTLNKLHLFFKEMGFSEIHVHQEEDFIMVIRHHPRTHQSVYLITHTAFQLKPFHIVNRGYPQFQYAGDFKEEIISVFTAPIDVSSFEKQPKYINGVSQFLQIPSIPIYRVDHQKKSIQLLQFPIGSVLAFSTELTIIQQKALKAMKTMELSLPSNLNDLSFTDLNYFLYTCHEEERSINPKGGVYNIPEYGNLSYSGIAGVYYLFQKIKQSNALNHPLCRNLREGHWLLNYLVERISDQSSSIYELFIWMSSYITQIKKFPDFLQPKYVERLIRLLFTSCQSHALSKMSPFIQSHVENKFISSLAMCSIQLVGAIPSSPLIREDHPLYKPSNMFPSLAAGLPHFSAGYMRNWGRDTFISLRGLLLVTGRYEEARAIIQSYASCLRHGLIPNLLDGGRSPRYNARDSVWWFLQAIQDYCSFLYSSPSDDNNNNNNNSSSSSSFIDYEGIAQFLNNTMIDRYYEPYTMEYNPPPPSQEKEAQQQQQQQGSMQSNSSPSSISSLSSAPILVQSSSSSSALYHKTREYQQTSLADVIQEILQMHANGIDFIEHNAGKTIDDKMSKEGFQIHIHVDFSTGFVHGGNEHNCGTWMDKMGSSSRAGNIGIPATPRDGADIEIIALLKSSLRWLSDLYLHDAFPYLGVTQIAFEDWNAKLQSSFEKHFYIPSDPKQDPLYTINPSVVNRRGIYKDVVGSKAEWADYQFRSNQCLALAIAPELFDRDHAQGAIRSIEEVLIGKLGVKTLDPLDWGYSPYYTLEDSDHYNTACGFNYHQGPEWVWPFGYYLKAVMNFNNDKEDLKFRILNKLANHEKEIKSSIWGGLTELTNKDGEYCAASCPTQAWSSSTILDALHSLFTSLS